MGRQRQKKQNSSCEGWTSVGSCYAISRPESRKLYWRSLLKNQTLAVVTHRKSNNEINILTYFTLAAILDCIWIRQLPCEPLIHKIKFISWLAKHNAVRMPQVEDLPSMREALGSLSCATRWEKCPFTSQAGSSQHNGYHYHYYLTGKRRDSHHRLVTREANSQYHWESLALSAAGSHYQSSSAKGTVRNLISGENPTSQNPEAKDPGFAQPLVCDWQLSLRGQLDVEAQQLSPLAGLSGAYSDVCCCFKVEILFCRASKHYSVEGAGEVKTIIKSYLQWNFMME